MVQLVRLGQTLGLCRGSGPGRASQQFFTDDGSFWPTLGGNISPTQLYVSSTDTTWYCWESYVNSNKRIEVTTYNHTTGLWSPRFKVGNTTILSGANVHGVPSMVRDSAGFVYIFCGAWNSQAHVFSTTLADDPSNWTDIADPTPGNVKMTYHHPVLVGSNIYISDQDSPEPDHTWAMRPCTFSGGVLTYGTRVTIIDQANRWIFSGQQVLIGTDIHLVWCSSDEAPADDLRQDVYYGIYKTATGAFTNFDGSVSVAAGSLPINTATAQASFRLFTSSAGDTGIVPCLQYDTNSHPHIVFAVGTGGNKFTSLTLKHLWHNGTSWQSPTNVGHLTDPYACPAVIQKPGGVMEIWWGEATGTPAPRGGIMKKASIDASGNVGAEQIVLKPYRATPSAYGLGTVQATPPTCHANARLTFCEIVGEDTSGQGSNNDGTLLCYSYGDAGFISRPKAVTYVNSEASAFITRMSVAPSVALSEMLDFVYTKLKAIGTLSATWDAIYPFCLHDSQAALLNMIAGNADCTLVQPTTPITFTAYRGFAGNGTDSYLESNINPSLGGTKYVLNSGAIGAFNNTNVDSTNPLAGLNDGSANASQFSCDGGTGNSAYRLNQGVSTTGSDTVTVGWKVIDRSASNRVDRYSNGVSVLNTVQVSTSIPNTTMRWGRVNTTFSSNQFSLGILRKSLSTANNLAEYRAFAPLMAYVGLI